MTVQLRKRTAAGDEGFTLIELMVVVLIIAILMAIAIPTFLSARAMASARAAEANLRNAVTDEQAYYSQQQAVSYGAASVLVDYRVDAAMSFTDTWPTARPAVYVDPTTDAGGQPAVLLGTTGVNGTNYWVYDDNGYLTYTTSTSSAVPSTLPLPSTTWP